MRKQKDANKSTMRQQTRVIMRLFDFLKGLLKALKVKHNYDNASILKRLINMSRETSPFIQHDKRSHYSYFLKQKTTFLVDLCQKSPGKQKAQRQERDVWVGHAQQSSREVHMSSALPVGWGYIRSRYSFLYHNTDIVSLHLLLRVESLY